MSEKQQIAITKVEEQRPETMYLLAKAEIDSQIATARAFPRSITAFYEKAMTLATINVDVAASCKYAMPRGGKVIEGPSVRLAEIVAATYGNIAVQARVIDNDGKTITAQGVCRDLETNNAVSIEVKARVTDKNGKPYNEDMQTMTGNAACAKARRNAIFACVPFAFIQPIYDKAEEVAKGTAQTLPARREKAIAYFKGLGVTEKQIFATLNVKGIEDITLEHLATLTAFMSSIKHEGMTASSIFDPKPEAQPKPSAKEQEATLHAEMIAGCKTWEELEELKINNPDIPAELFEARSKEIKGK